MFQHPIFKIVLGLFIFYIVISILGSIVKSSSAKRKEKKLESEDLKPLEKYISNSEMHSAFKCSKCGAAVPSKTDDHVTMFCPFCGNPLSEAKEVVDKAHQTRHDERNYNLETKRLAAKEREQNLELEKIRLQQLIEKEQARKKTTAMIFGIVSFAVLLFLALGAAGAFK